MGQQILLGNECVALGAVHAGLSAAYAYPGTPSTEITEFIIRYAKRHGRPHAAWCANEKTAYEEAIGTCFVGRRAIVSMKHVGLNVAADPFMNSSFLSLHGGLVIAVADDPGMHSSQNEQDSRFYADFARIPCLEPGSQQEAYDMTREAFDLSERFHVPVMLRLGTRLSHSRTGVTLREARAENPLVKATDRTGWILLPPNARRRWKALIALQHELVAYSEASPWNTLSLAPHSNGLGIITTGLARNYLLENLRDLPAPVSHLHVGVFPAPIAKLRQLAAHCDRILVLEDGQPFLERQLKGLLGAPVNVMGRTTGAVPPDGELTPDVVRAALGLDVHSGLSAPGLPNRPPQLCQGCPHGHAYTTLNAALAGFGQTIVTSDIGCYTLGALPPWNAGDSCVCMGASIGMAKGAAEAGFHPAVAVIGDSTFLHSGMPALLDAAVHDTPMTLIILDNRAVAMTGVQDPLTDPARLMDIVLALGVKPEHVHVIEPHPRKVRENAEVLRREIDHPGLSVVIASKECKEMTKKKARLQEATA
jgi:indolepyruvate ferredoxin oxidoreductase alpha subunit